MVSLVKRDWDVIFFEKKSISIKKHFTITNMGVDYYKEIKLYGFL